MIPGRRDGVRHGVCVGSVGGVACGLPPHRDPSPGVVVVPPTSSCQKYVRATHCAKEQRRLALCFRHAAAGIGRGRQFEEGLAQILAGVGLVRVGSTHTGASSITCRARCQATCTFGFGISSIDFLSVTATCAFPAPHVAPICVSGVCDEDQLWPQVRSTLAVNARSPKGGTHVLSTPCCARASMLQRWWSC